MRSALKMRLLLTALTFVPSVWSPFAQGQEVRADIVTSRLQNPWAVAFLPDGRFLVTERAGRLRLLSGDGKAGRTARDHGGRAGRPA